MELRDKVAVVTGAGSGLGAAICAGLAAAGATVVVTDVDGAAATAIAEGIPTGIGRAVGRALDVTDQDQVTATMDATAAEHGRLDILVNSAGVRFISPFPDVDRRSWDLTIAVNLTGTFLCSQAAVRHMLRRGRGKIVNIASVTGMLALTARAPYAASKAGIIGLTKAMAYELSSHGIFVNAVSPGPIETPMNAPYFNDPAMMAILHKEIPRGSWGQPQDVVEAVLFLVSDRSDYICGANLTVDGGWTAGKGY
jgi:NAD(P)-dependent dehydrogenase (short-subunit alcohol dehydrogenase family)